MNYQKGGGDNMTEIILVICGLAFGAICLAVGYGLGKKKKIAEVVTDYANAASNKVKDVAGKVLGGATWNGRM